MRFLLQGRLRLWKRLRLRFRLDIGLLSRILAMLMGTMFDTAFQRFAAAFEKRADAVYGRPGVSRSV